jgi:hypothetical protein
LVVRLSFFQYDQLSKEKSAESSSEREELLNKLREFGHFATSKIAPKELDLDSKPDPKPEEPKVSETAPEVRARV